MNDAFLARQALVARIVAVRARVFNRLQARLSGFAHPVTAFVSQPEPKTIGSFARGRQLMAGNFRFAGCLVEAPDTSIWEIQAPPGAFVDNLHGFEWLDDLAAVGTSSACHLAQIWLADWIERYGRGQGPGWKPELAGRRIIRWINHAVFLLKGMDRDASESFFQNLARQSLFLKRRWRSAPAGLPRFESLTGMIYAGLALEGAGILVDLASQAIADECGRCIETDGGIPSRNPQELTQVFTLLNWAASALSEGGKMPKRPHLLAIERIAPTLRSLRHADGSLARFHGGGRGAEGVLDQALAASGVRATATTGLAMGYARLSAGRTSVIVDASPPPSDAQCLNAHASTLAFELTSARRPLIVSCGSGAQFGEDWRRAARSTPSHSTLGIEGYSSSRFGDGGNMSEVLLYTPRDVRIQQSAGLDGSTLLATHNGYTNTHGLLHVRRLDLSLDGCKLTGEDTLGALSENDRITFENLMNKTHMNAVKFEVRFHLHPDVTVSIDMGGNAVSLALKSGEVWVFRQSGSEKLSVDPSVYLESGRLKPRATKQIVLTGSILNYSSQISWSLSRAQDGKRHIRDLAEGDPQAMG